MMLTYWNDSSMLEWWMKIKSYSYFFEHRGVVTPQPPLSRKSFDSGDPWPPAVTNGCRKQLVTSEGYGLCFVIILSLYHSSVLLLFTVLESNTFPRHKNVNFVWVSEVNTKGPETAVLKAEPSCGSCYGAETSERKWGKKSNIEGLCSYSQIFSWDSLYLEQGIIKKCVNSVTVHLYRM